MPDTAHVPVVVNLGDRVILCGLPRFYAVLQNTKHVTNFEGSKLSVSHFDPRYIPPVSAAHSFDSAASCVAVVATASHMMTRNSAGHFAIIISRSRGSSRAAAFAAILSA